MTVVCWPCAGRLLSTLWALPSVGLRPLRNFPWWWPTSNDVS